MAADATKKKLYRADEGAYVGGVCAGLAEYFEFDTIVVRILAVLLFILTLGVAVIAYFFLWAVVPLEPEHTAPYEVTPESAESTAFGCVDFSSYAAGSKTSSISLLARLAVAAGLMVLFLVAAVNLSPLVPGTDWWQFWPLVLLMAGLCLIIIPIRTPYEAVWHAAGIVLTSLSATMLPMSLGILSWGTVGSAFEKLWPLVVSAGIMFGVGIYFKRDAYLLGSAFCFVIFCVMGLLFCTVPGETELLFVYMPDGRMLKLGFLG